MKKQNFLQGALILVIASVVVKVFGAIFKIPLTNIIGVTAMAYFNTAYGFYVIFYMISTAGIPVALSKMISEAEAKNNRAEISKIFRVSYILFFILGVIGTIVMILFSKAYSNYVRLEGLHYSIIAISTTLFFMCITSAYRGYFQGLKNMFPTAVSQVIGASGKLFVGLFVASLTSSLGLPPHLVASLTLLGITTGSVGSTVYLSVYKSICDKKDKDISKESYTSTDSSASLLKKLIIIAIPITLSATILSLTNTVDTTLMVRRLVVSGIEKAEATKIMGAYTSMSVPLNNLSPNLIYPFAISVIPAITGMFVSGQKQDGHFVISSALRIASIISIPCSIGLSVFSKPIIKLLYNKSDELIYYGGKSIQATEIAGEMLTILAASVFFIAMVSVTNAVLQAYKLETKTIISTTIGILLKIILNYFLIGNPSTAILGAPISTLICYIAITSVNLAFILKYTDYKPNVFSAIVKSIISAAGGVGIAYAFFSLPLEASSKVLTAVSILIAAILYFMMMFLLKGVAKEDILMLPKGEKIYALLKKCKALQ